jgi:hypothetical protein
VSRESVVGIAIQYRLDGQKVECRWARHFSNPRTPALHPPKLLHSKHRAQIMYI